MFQQNLYTYTRERRLFGRQCRFGDLTQFLLNIAPSYKRRLNYILKNPITLSTQLSDQKALSEMETENVTYAEHGMSHYEGGWPKEINMYDEEQTLRHRKKIEREDNWGQQVPDLIRSAIKISEQNSAVNIYRDFFAELPPEAGQGIRAEFKARPENVLRDYNATSRAVNVINWMPNNPLNFLVVHTAEEEPQVNPKLEAAEAESKKPSKDTQWEPLVQNNESYDSKTEHTFFAWDTKNPLKPLVSYEGFERARRAYYCPRDEMFIAGGFHTGGVAVWDALVGGMPLQYSPLETNHREPVSALCWVHSKLNTEFYTGSFDGTIKYWDTRDLSSSLMEVLLDPNETEEPERQNAHGITVLEFEYTIPVRFIVGSDMGFIFLGNRKGATPEEVLVANYKLFEGPIRTIHRNPFFVKNFLITGDWCAKVWSEECKGAPTTLLIKKKCQITCGAWSNTRCSLFATGDENGELDFYDLLLSQSEPIYRIKFKWAIKDIKFREGGEYLAVGFDNGDVYIIELDFAMTRSGPKDKPLIGAIFERETLRSRLLEGRVEEIKLRAKMESEPVAVPTEETQLTERAVANLDDPEEFLAAIEADEEFKLAMQTFFEMLQDIDRRRRDREYVMERTDFEMVYDLAPPLPIGPPPRQ